MADKTFDQIREEQLSCLYADDTEREVKKFILKSLGTEIDLDYAASLLQGYIAALNCKHEHTSTEWKTKYIPNSSSTKSVQKTRCSDCRKWLN